MRRLIKEDLKSKKGSVIDIAFLLVSLLGLAIFILIISYVFPQITAGLRNSEIGTNNASVIALDRTDTTVGSLDYIFLVIFFGLTASVFITSFLINSSPIFVPIYILVLAILIIYAVVISNVYGEFAASSTFASVAASHVITAAILDRIVLITIGIGLLSMVLIFAKPKQQNYSAY